MANEFLEATNRGQVANQQLILQLLNMRQRQEQHDQQAAFRDRDLSVEQQRVTETAKQHKIANERAEATNNRLIGAQEFRQKLATDLHTIKLGELVKEDQIVKIKEGEEAEFIDSATGIGYRLTTDKEVGKKKAERMQVALTGEFNAHNNFRVAHGVEPLDPDTFAKIRLLPSLVRNTGLREMSEQAATEAANAQFPNDPTAAAMQANRNFNTMQRQGKPQPRTPGALTAAANLKAVGRGLVNVMFRMVGEDHPGLTIEEQARVLEKKTPFYMQSALDFQGITGEKERFMLEGEMFSALESMIGSEKIRNIMNEFFSRLLNPSDGDPDMGKNRNKVKNFNDTDDGGSPHGDTER